MHTSEEDINYWQLSTQLEEGRNRVLRMVARNENLELILNTLCKSAQIYNPEILCSVLQLNNETKTLHPIASVSLPDFYCQALDGVSIGAGVGSCGTAAFSKKRVIVENINTHPSWNQYKELALSAGVQSCWSEPIMGGDGVVFGTFAIYYRTPKAPTKNDLNFIEVSANLAAVVFENHKNREQLLNANNLLSKTVNDRTHELVRVNLELEKLIDKQNKQYHLDIKTEKMLTTNSLICGFSHEISTPVGTALTAISTAEAKLVSLSNDFSSGSLTRNEFINKTYLLAEVIEISKNSLLRANTLLQRFKNVNTFASMEDKSSFSMIAFLNEIKESMGDLIGPHQLSVQSADFEIIYNKESLWQIFFNLIENSIVHGFIDMPVGSIHINVTSNDEEIVINFQDNGCGISEEKTSKIFEPFYTSARNKKSLGLGLNIINNLINHNLKGRLKLVKSPIGVRYEIILPKGE